MSYNWFSVAQEDQLFDEVERRRSQHQALRNSLPPKAAETASGLADAFPWVEPGVVQSLTQAGVSADNPIAELIAKQAGRVALQDGELDEPLSDVPDNMVEAVWDLTKDYGGGGVRGMGYLTIAALATPLEEAFERFIPAFAATELETEPLIPPVEQTGNLLFDVLVTPGRELNNLLSSVSRPLQGEFWDTFFNEKLPQAAPSTGALVVGDFMRGGLDEIQLIGTEEGEGLISNFDRRQALRSRLQFPEGGTITFGRTIAREVTEPHSEPYEVLSGLVDFGANLAPVDLGLGKLSKGVRGASQAGQRFGLIPGISKRADTNTTRNFLNSPVGQRYSQLIADTDSIGDIWTMTGRADHVLAKQLRDTSDVNEVNRLLSTGVGIGATQRAQQQIPTAPFRGLGSVFGDYASVFGPGAAARRSLSNVRLIQEVPGRKLNPDDLRGTAREVHNFIRNAKLGDDAVDRYLTRLADVDKGDSASLANLTFDLLEETMEKIASREKLIRTGRQFTKNEAKKITRAYRNTFRDLKLYATDELANNMDVIGARHVIDGGQIDLRPAIHLTSELANGFIPLPDPRAIRRATSFFGRIYSVPGLGDAALKSITLADNLMSHWKGLQLITRFAYPVRVLMEEQARMAGAGLDSMFRHPASYIQWVMGRKGGQTLKGQKLATGADLFKSDNFIDEVLEYQMALSRGSAGWKGQPGEILSGRWVRVEKGEEDYFRGAATELHQLANAPEAQRVAGGLGKKDLASIGMEPRKTAIEVSLPGGGVRSMSRSEFKKWYNDLEQSVLRNEKFSDPANWTAAERAAFDAGDFRKFSRLRGYTDEQIEEFSIWRELNEGLEPSRTVSYPEGSPNFGAVAQAADPDEIFDAARGFDPSSTLDAVKEWFWQGTGQGFRKQLARVEGHEDLLTPDGAFRHIDTIQERIQIKTGGNTDLIEAVVKGKLGNVNFRRTLGPNKLARELENYEDFLPQKVKVEEVIRTEDAGIIDRATEFLFSALMSKPTNALSRSPFWRQKYWGQVEQLLPNATREVQEQAIRGFRAAGLAKSQDVLFSDGDVERILGGIRFAFNRDDELRLTRIVNKGSGEAIQSMDELDELAKAFALDETRDLLYDLNRRSQFFDAARLVFPFGEAWKEIFTAWTRILKENPAMLRRGQQALEGGLGPEFGEFGSTFLGTGTQPGNGLFYTDPVSGEMFFTYPMSEFVSDFMLLPDEFSIRDMNPANFGGRLWDAAFGEDPAAQFTLAGSLTSLNLFSATFLPGFGPMVTVPAAVVLPDKRHGFTESIYNLLFPFGEPELSQGLLEANLPTWMQKIRTAVVGDPDADRLYANTVKDVMNALVRTGEYSNDSPEAQRRLLEQGRTRANALFWIRGLAQSTLPTGPAFRWQTEDIKGNLVPMKVLSDHYFQLLEQYDGDTDRAVGEWLRRFGTKNLLALQGKSRSVVYRPLTEESDGWIQARPELAENHELVIGFFAPDPTNGEFDYNAYIRSLDEGWRQQLTPQEMLRFSNDFLGNLAYQHLKSTLSGRDDIQTSLFLAQARDQLANDYPGFDSDLGKTQAAKTDELIRELERAITESSELAETDVGRGIRIYLDARAAAQGAVDEHRDNLPGRPHGFTRAKSTKPLRDWLRAVGEELIDEYPDFRNVWHRVFRREFAQAPENQ